MPQELAEDILDTILIDQDISFQDAFNWSMCFETVQDILLVFEWDPGVWYKQGGEDGVSSAAFFT